MKQYIFRATSLFLLTKTLKFGASVFGTDVARSAQSE